VSKPENIILDKSFEFAIKIISLCVILKNKNEFILSKQLLKSGTSIGANIEEAIGAYSKKEFASKMGIALKEARETRYWLALLNKSQLVQHDYSLYLKDIEDIVNILTAIVKTSQLSNKVLINA
jgi:four helix bundle protein